MNYYVYILVDPRDNQPFYVGKGYKRRMYSHERETKSGQWNNKEKCKQIRSIWEAGLTVHYLTESCESDEQSRIREKELIQLYGRRCNKSGILTNVHVGGNGGGRVGKPICQYTKTGEFVAEFDSASEAERQTGVLLSKITAVCRGEWKLAGGFQWRLKGDNPIVDYERENLVNRTPVYQYAMDGEFVAAYDSQVAACKTLGIPLNSATKISACCNNKLPSYYGYQWSSTRVDNMTGKKPQRKRIAQYTIDGILITTFESIAAAVRHTNITTISSCCNNKTKQAGGYKWLFIST